jgi:hypothetical protein
MLGEVDLAEVITGAVAARRDRRPEGVQRTLAQRAAVEAGEGLGAHVTFRDLSTVGF